MIPIIEPDPSYVKIILEDQNNVCWKFYITEDMVIEEVMYNIKYQFYVDFDKSFIKESKIN